ncbi:uncharacterized protein LOC132550550 [Ylistrum balloti]|uniref:uncharacterized protein LOC132550550 n=1 Tax=Ylistrum balloti TaxID=509963 RepID=UPI00290599F5|nr:uncharacterized protein LOC132550550 [Ylistrum balloti]
MAHVKYILRYLTFSLLVWHVVSKIENIDIPSKLVDCFSNWARNENIRNIAGENVLHTCMSSFLWKTGKERWSPDFDPNIVKFIAEEGKERNRLIDETSNPKTKTALPFRKPYVRKEYRMLSNKERRRYHRAVKALKNDKRLKPNTYDAIANYHNTEIQHSAHWGPNFLGWHRIYLMTYEDALRKIDPDVTLPYWDCTLDEPMSDPSKSIIFSRRFAGNSDGEVDTGPYKDWEHEEFGKLTRAANNGGELMSYQDVDNFLSKDYTSEITVPNAESQYNIEHFHGRIHTFVGGHLGNLVSAAHDPLFYMLHAFIDYIWWRFRNQQEANGIDPSMDYPETDIDGHQANDIMNGFGMYRNIDGYSRNWTRDIYTYEMSPTCSKDQSWSCNSKWLICQHHTGRCVSKGRRRTNSFRPERFDTLMTSTTAELCEMEDIVQDTCFKMDTTIQNTFVLDGIADTSKWAYFPIKIINERKQFEKFRAFDVEDGIANQTLDIYDTEKYAELRKHEDFGDMGTNRKCQLSGSGASKIFVDVYGLNYYGFSTDYTIVDERMALSVGYSYLPIREPTNKPSEVFVAAYDSCGRLCKPYCKVDGTYKRCTATIRINNDTPQHYGKNYADALLNTWRFDGDGVPETTDDRVHLVFYCNRKEEWPWQQYNN